jgi:hypothetical protein
MSSIEKYLTTYAEPESQSLANFPTGFRQGLVVPFYRESCAALERFCQFAADHCGSLLIIILNRPDTDSSKQWAKDYFLNIPVLKQAPLWETNTKPLKLYKLANQSALLVVDRCIQGPAIPVKQGVGLARKIGADILCALIKQKKVYSPWISNTDADAHLPQDYFQKNPTDNTQKNHHSTKISAKIYPFFHIAIADTTLLPTLLYEFSLHYYVAGLQWARSPYAHHSIGSVIAVDYKHYAMVRGFPKRAAAEDFYLLNKLAKTAAIATLSSPSIQLEARESTRVPFGTGPAVIQLTQLDNLFNMPLYHPDSFLYLRFLLNLLQQLSRLRSTIDECAYQLLAATPSPIDLDILLSIIKDLNLEQALQHSYTQGNSYKTRLQHLHQWFDGFKTLKFIHLLRGQHLGTISYQQWLDNHVAFPATAKLDSVSKQIKDLC